MKIAIVQSNYIPWKGYFDLINMSDKFILLDDVQYTKRDWRNRNIIKTVNGLKWITIPVKVKDKYFQKTNVTEVSEKKWGIKHWKMLSHTYSKTLYFKKYHEIFEELYLNIKSILLSEINFNFITTINYLLGINTEILWSHDFQIMSSDKSEKIVKLCKAVGGTEYITGPAAKNYINKDLFDQKNISITWMNYSNYPRYRQINGEFVHGVSILDLIFNEGKNAPKFMKSF